MLQHDTLRAFIYCRVSTREQGTDDHYSLDNQEQRCRDYVTMKRWQTGKLRKDVASGKDDNRDGFQQLLADVAAKKIDVVIVYRLDRLSRNVRDIYDFLDRIKQSGIAFVSVTEGFDTTTAMGRAMLGVAAVFAQLTREMISENTRDGLLRRAEAGYYLGNPTRSYGYSYSSETGVLLPDSEESPAIKQIFTWFTEHKWGVFKIARALNLRGIPSKTGGEWSENTVSSMLRNPLYAGYVRAGENLVQGQHESIITLEQYEAAQTIIKSRQTLPFRTHQSPHLLSGVIRCGQCGRRLRAHYDHAGKADQNGARKSYVMYGHPRTAAVKDGACSGLYKSASAIEKAIIEQIAKASVSGELSRVALQDVKSRRKSSLAPKVSERDKILLELASIGDKFTQWADRLDAGRIDEEQFEAQNRRLLDRKKSLQSRMEDIDAELAKEATVEVSLAEVRKALNDFPAVWDHLEFEERRELLRLLIEYLHVYKTHAELKLLFHEPVTIPLDFKRGRETMVTSQDHSVQANIVLQ